MVVYKIEMFKIYVHCLIIIITNVLSKEIKIWNIVRIVENDELIICLKAIEVVQQKVKNIHSKLSVFLP